MSRIISASEQRVNPPRCTAAVRTMAASLDAVASVLDQNDHHPKWVPFLLESRRVEKASILERMVYNRFKLPWPVADRDFVFRVTAIPDHDKKTMDCVMRSAVHPSMPEQDGVVRATLLESVFTLTEIGPEQTRVELSYKFDPKGLIPAGLCSAFRYPWSYFVLKRLAAEVASRC